jgi:cysteine desulfurase
MIRHYFDHASTTPVDARVVREMCAYLEIEGQFGNPASTTHGFGWEASEAVEAARELVADTLGADPREIVWTSGATEADNLAIKGLFEATATSTGRNKIVTLASEHKAVLDPVQYLQRHAGADVVVLNPLPSGLIDLDALEAVLDQTTLLVSVMAVNNETGVIQPLAEIAQRTRVHGAYLHSDMAQAIGKIDTDVAQLGVDLASLSAHKVHGPKGVGALYVRRGQFRVAEQMHGGGHERGMRSGTLPTHQLVGMAAAYRLGQSEGPEDRLRLQRYRQRVLEALAKLGGVRVNGEGVPHILNITVDGVEAEPLMAAMPEIAISTGSACNSATLEPSHVLRSMGLSRQEGLSSLRVSFGRTTSDPDIIALIDALTRAISGLRRST